MSAPRPLAIIPARGGSKRIPRKNIADVCGKPMIGWVIETALHTDIFGKIVVSTEDDEIARIAANFGAHIVPRPPELATDTAAEIDAYAQVLDVLAAQGETPPEFFCGLYPTAILLTPDDLTDAFQKFDTGADVVMGVSDYPIHPYKALQHNDAGFLEMLHPHECNNLRSQDYPPYVASNGTFYWFRRDSFAKNRDYYPEKLAGHIVPRLHAVDIDTPEDLEVARLYKQHQSGLRG